MDYWQVIRRPATGGHQSVADFLTENAARAEAARMNTDFHTDEYTVIHRTAEGFAGSLHDWWNGKHFPLDLMHKTKGNTP